MVCFTKTQSNMILSNFEKNSFKSRFTNNLFQEDEFQCNSLSLILTWNSFIFKFDLFHFMLALQVGDGVTISDITKGEEVMN